MQHSILKRLSYLAVFAAFASPAHAYLDPGTGSLLLQGAIAAIAASAFTIKTYWYRIRAYLKGEKWTPPSLDEEDEEDNSQSTD
ncbi:MAG: hypothetical protein ACR2PS_02165 [Pseudomonadales bacterium]